MPEFKHQPTGLLQERRLARRLFPSSGSVLVGHENTTPESAREYLLLAGSRNEDINSFLDQNGQWVLIDSNLNPYVIPPIELKTRMIADLQTVYESAQDSLGAVNWFGYNDHGPLHIASVTNRAFTISQSLGLDENSIRRIVIAAVGHDVGNLVNRDIHSLVSPLILERIYPQLKNNPGEWRIIRRAIQMHNSGVFDYYLDVEKGLWKNLDAEARVQKFAEQFGIEAAVLLISDKIDVGRHRVNFKARSRDAIDQHQYSEINLHNQTDSYRVEDDNVVWTLHFNPFLRPEEVNTFGDATIIDRNSPSNYSTYASELVRSENGKPDFHKAKLQLLKKHNSAIYITALTGFVLFPETNKFILRFVDSTDQNRVFEHIFLKREIDAIKGLKDLNL